MQKIAFLFLVINGVYHENYWCDFLRGHENQYTLYVHSKDGIPESSLFKKFALKNTVPTTWANTMKAQLELLKTAILDPENQKFIFISESTLPIQDFDMVYKTVFSTDKSMFCYTPNPHQNPLDVFYTKRNLNKIHQKFRYKNAQWILLNRNHAELMAHDTRCIDILTRYESDQELYPATFLATLGKLDEVLQHDVTCVNWSRYSFMGTQRMRPFCFANLHSFYELDYLLNAVNNGFLFARKFNKSAMLSELDYYLPYRDNPDNTPNKTPVSLYNYKVRDRYTLLKTVLDTLSQPFTFLDIGAQQAYYGFAIAQDYDAISIFMNQKNSTPDLELPLITICNAKRYVQNVMVLDSTITSQNMNYLKDHEHIDVLLISSPLKNIFGDSWNNTLEIIMGMTSNTIIEIGDDPDNQKIRNYLYSHGGTILGKIGTSVLYHLKSKNNFSQHQLPGIHLSTFKKLNGIYPSEKTIETLIKNKQLSDYGSEYLIIQGHTIIPQKESALWYAGMSLLYSILHHAISLFRLIISMIFQSHEG